MTSKNSFEYYSEELDKLEIKHMTRAQLAALHRLSLDGSREAWEMLWIYGTKLVLKICFTLAKQDLLRSTFEDAVAEGNLAIGEALTRWNPKKSAFGTWIWIRIRGAILNGNAKAQLGGMVGDLEDRPRIVSEAAHAVSGDKEAILNSLVDLTAEAEDPIEEVVYAKLREALSQLPEREFDYVVKHYYRDVSQVDLATVEGVSQQMVAKVLRRAEARMKNFLSEGL